MASYFYRIKVEELEIKIKNILIQKVVPYDKSKILLIEKQYIEYLSNGFRGTDIFLHKESENGLYCYHVNKDSSTDAPAIENKLTKNFFEEKIYEIIETECVNVIPNNCELEKSLEIARKNFKKIKDETMQIMSQTLIENCNKNIEIAVKTQFKITNNLGVEKIREIKKGMVYITDITKDNVDELANDKFLHCDTIKDEIAIIIKKQEEMINNLLVKYGYDKINESKSFMNKLFDNESSDSGVRKLIYYLNECEQALSNISNCKKQMNNLQKKLEELNTKIETEKAVDLWKQA
ncbi:hypothetical protein [Clostridium sp. ZBS4]|uniref:hypothetical protein n=1 Tax=Clostridium sp. ZBS4 TaxID=2949974 RepID=UPI00207965E2|nr:hypothetical protein [Clostridium sp. ZBS4]